MPRASKSGNVERELLMAMKGIAISLESVAQSLRAISEGYTAEQGRSRRGPVITRIGQATYDREQRAREAGEDVPGFRRR